MARSGADAEKALSTVADWSIHEYMRIVAPGSAAWRSRASSTKFADSGAFVAGSTNRGSQKCTSVEEPFWSARYSSSQPTAQPWVIATT